MDYRNNNSTVLTLFVCSVFLHHITYFEPLFFGCLETVDFVDKKGVLPHVQSDFLLEQVDEKKLKKNQLIHIHQEMTCR